MKPDHQSLVEAVEKLKKSGKIKKDKEIAEKTGFSPTTVSSYLTGARTPSRNFIDKFTEVYKLQTLQPKTINIPFYDADVVGGNLPEVNDKVISTPSYYIDLATYRDCNVAYRLKGQSMEPEIRNGDLVLGRWVDDKTIINYGDIYLVVTKEMSVTKILRKATSPDKLRLVSVNNTEYDDYEIDRDSIIKIAKIKVALKDL